MEMAPGAIKDTFSTLLPPPSGTIGATTIPEYQLPSVNGIHTITASSSDYFGGFPTVPTINGYKYFYSVCLGSTSISRGNANGGNSGGYIRGIRYTFLRFPHQRYAPALHHDVCLCHGAGKRDPQLPLRPTTCSPQPLRRLTAL